MYLIPTIAATLFTSLFLEAAKKSGGYIDRPIPPETDPDEGITMVGQSRQESERIMSYDLYDDEIEGAVGEYDIVGDDDDMDLEDLLVEGMGDSEIVGEDLLIGARRRRPRRSRRAAVRRLAQRNAAAVVKTGLDKRRRYPLGFVPTTITSGSTTSVPSSPQNLYRAERLVIPSDIAFDLGITDIKVGNQSQFVQNVEVPAAIFSEVAIDTAVHFDTAEVGNQVSVSARNKSASSVEFTAALIGTAAK